MLADSGARAVIVEGAPVVRSNIASGSGADLFLPPGFVLTMGAALLSEAEIGITLEHEAGTFTSGYATRSGDGNPKDFFAVGEDLEVGLSDGEAQIIAPDAKPTEKPDEGQGNGEQHLSPREWH